MLISYTFPIKKQRFSTIILLLLGLFYVGLTQGEQPEATASVGHLRCEYHENPMGVDRANPLLSWWLISSQRGQKQEAYQILVSSDPALLSQDKGDLWDSGKVASDQSTQVEYAGKPLVSRMSCFWKVRSWDSNGKETEWSKPAFWTMGILNDSKWKGVWIAARDLPVGGGSGYLAKVSKVADESKWIQIDLGAPTSMDSIQLHPLDYEDNPGFGFPVRYRVEASDDEEFKSPHVIADYTKEDVPSPGDKVVVIDAHKIQTRYVRITATKLWQRPKNKNEYCFGLEGVTIFSNGKNVAFQKKVTSSEGIADWEIWGKNFLTDTMDGTHQKRKEAILMRKEVSLSQKPVRAVARIAALGFADLIINGEKVGDHFMAPAFSNYTKRVYYDSYDVTKLMKDGRNSIGAILGNGFFSTPTRGWNSWYGVGSEPQVTAEIELTNADGSTSFIVTDTTWLWSTGEITFNDFWKGEVQDLRLRKDGWDKPDFTESSWSPVVQAKAPPGGLRANPGAPVRVTKVIHPIRVEGNAYLFDAMYSGFPTVRVKGAPGEKIVINGATQCEFTLKGDGEEILEPRFMVHTLGPRLTINGLSQPLSLDAVTINWTHADLQKDGDFSCSNPFLNRVYQAEERTHWSYNGDFPADPTREKSGWTQDVQTMIDSAAYMSDVGAFYKRWWIDMADSQSADGSCNSVTPMPWGEKVQIWDDPWWSGMIIYLPYKHYQYYGDKSFLEQAYTPMKSYLNWLSAKADKKDGLMHWAGASDWIEVGIDGWGPPKRTPTFMVSTCAWYLYADMLRQMSQILGKSHDTAAFAQLAQQIKETLNKKCFDPSTGLYAGATNSQTALILPLCLGMVPDGKKSLVIDRLQENIHQWKDHLSTGFVGTPYLLEGLPIFGLTELSYKIVNQQDYAGWNTLISDGVLKETWRGGMAQMPSLGGSIGQWFYKAAAGIYPDPSAPGFKKIIIRPSMMGDLKWVKCWHDCLYGKIVSNWSLEGSTLTMQVTIPPNTTATIRVPTSSPDQVQESGKPVSNADGIKILKSEPGALFLEVGSGKYQFTASF